MNGPQNRNKTIDIAKGIGITLVVLGHCLYYPGLICGFIFSFHMPLFFLLSGIYAKQGDNIKIFKRKFNSLVRPFIYYWCVGLVISIIIPTFRFKLSLTGLVKDFYTMSPDVSNNSSIWFLIALFWVHVIFNFIPIKKNSHVLVFSPLMVYLIGIVLDRIIKTFSVFFPFGRLPFNLDTVMIALSFFLIGFIFKDCLKKMTVLSIKIIFIIVVLTFSLQLIMLMFNGGVNLHGLSFGNPIIYFIQGVNGSILVLSISELIARSSLNIKDKIAAKGRESLFILCIQSIIIRTNIVLINYLFEKKYELYLVDGMMGAILFLISEIIIVLLLIIRNKVKNEF